MKNVQIVKLFLKKSFYLTVLFVSKKVNGKKTICDSNVHIVNRI